MTPNEIYFIETKNSHNDMESYYIFNGIFKRKWGTLYSVRLMFVINNYSKTITFHDKENIGLENSEYLRLDTCHPRETLLKLFTWKTRENE